MTISKQRFLIYFLFAFSGFTGLIYESLWAYYLKLLLGHSSYGQITTLTIFMGGLSIGAYWGGKHVYLLKKPLYLYAVIEVLIGLGAITYHPVFVFFKQYLPTIFQVFNDSLFWILCIKLSFAFVLTAPWAILLGMTFPCLTIAVIELQGDQGQRSLPGLYFINTLGGSVGILCASFVLISTFGTQGTLVFAGCSNLCLGLSFFILGRYTKTYTVKPSPEGLRIQDKQLQIAPEPPALTLTLLGVVLGTGMASFLYEIAWIRLLSLSMGSSTHSFDLMISAFIFGLAGGGLFSSFLLKKGIPILFMVGVIQVLMGCFATLSLIGYEYLFVLMNNSHQIFQSTTEAFFLYSIFKYLLCLGLMFPASFCAGMTLPFITIWLLQTSGKKSVIGTVYACNTLGAICGIILGSLWILPLLQLKGTLLLGALLDILLGLFLFWKLRIDKKTQIFIGGLSFVVFIPVLFFPLNNFTLSAGVFRSPIALKTQEKNHITKPQIRHGRTATISFHDYGRKRVIKTNGKIDAGISLSPYAQISKDEVTQLALAAYGMHLQANPYQAAMIGLGSGMTAHYLLGDPLLKHLDMIEIEAEMYKLARGFQPYNNRVYQSPKITTTIDDARTFFASQNKQYDLIISEPSNPWISGVSSLFSQEFYQDIRSFLKPKGQLIQWVQTYEFSSELFLSILTAISREFQYYSVYGLPSNTPGKIGKEDLIIIASNAPIQMPISSKIRKISNLSQDMTRLKMKPNIFNKSCRIVTQDTLHSILQNRRANSDFFPIVDQAAEKFMFTKSSIRLDKFLLLTPVFYQDLFENDHHEIIQIRLSSNKSQRDTVIQQLDYLLHAPNAIKEHVQIKRLYDYLIRNHFAALDLKSTTFVDYGTYLQAQKYQTRWLGLQLVQNWQNTQKHLLLLEALLNRPYSEIESDLARMMVFVALKTQNLSVFTQTLKPFLLRSDIEREEKELLQNFLPGAKNQQIPSFASMR